MTLRLVPRDAPPPALEPVVETCVTCGAPAGTPYCARCGERRAADRPYTWHSLVDELWDAFSPVDGRVGRTLLTLLRRPGELTAAYMRGVRMPYVPPLRLFLLVNVVFFLNASIGERVRIALPHARAWTGGNRSFDTPLWVHLTNTAHARVARRLVRQHVPPRRGESAIAYNARIDRDYRPRFDAESTTQAKTLLIAMVPMFALLIGAVEWRRRRHAVQHLVLATHAIALLLLIVVAAQWVVGLPEAAALALSDSSPDAANQDLLITVPMLAAFALWLRGALRRAYGDGPIAATIKAVALALGFGLVLFAYRALLFVTTLYAT